MPPGRPWCRAWTEVVDDALRSWLPAVGAGRGVALVALGGYARRELCPASDIDLLLLHDGWPHPDLEALVRSVCYPLWDAGLSVGYAVHTGQQAVQAAQDTLDTATALADRRLVAGDAGLLEDLAARLRSWLRAHGSEVLEALTASDEQRHAVAGAHPGMLEPDLKHGAGGLRDLHGLRWAGACLLGEADLDALVGARYLGAADRGALAMAGDTVLAARCALHLVHSSRPPGGDRDRLRLDLQDEVADVMGLSHADDLLCQVNLAARTITHVRGRTWPLLAADARGGRRHRRNGAQRVDRAIRLVDGLVEIDDDADITADPALGMRAVAAAAARGVHFGRASAARLRRQLEEGARLRWDDDSRNALFATLRAGPAAVPALADADHLGLLSAYWPEWSRVRGRPQRNPLHRYDLDTHCIEAVAELARVAEGVYDPGHRDLWQGLADPDSLALATLLHDIGKAWPGDHSIAGARVAHDWVIRMGCSQRRADRVSRLVRLHLLMPHAATRRDLDDDDELVAVAELVGDRETVDGLYLLSHADARATGPHAHSAWKDLLLAKLHSGVRRLLTVDTDTRTAPFGPPTVVAQARRLAGDDVELDALLRGVPRRYLHAADAEQVIEHARLLQPPPAPGELRVRRRHGPAEDTTTLTIVAADRRGLMGDCAGVLASYGVEVLDARAYTRTDGVALDWFVVRAQSDVDWEAVTATLEEAAAGTADVAELVRRREARRTQSRPPGERHVPVEVRFDRRPMTTRIEVHGPDRPGMLYRLACVLADEGLTVVGARVATVGDEAHDVFFVRPVGGPPDTDALEPLLRAALDPPSDASTH